MKIAILGTGVVGRTLAGRLTALGHPVMIGSREAKTQASPPAVAPFAEAAAFGEIIFDCTNGANALAALRLAGAGPLRGKILVSVGNPLDFSRGMPPTLTVCNTDSLGEQVQREFPETRVVKALNTVNCEVMINPSTVPGAHVLFICGNDAEAKTKVAGCLCQWFGWKSEQFVDLGDITGARGMEMWMPLWLRLFGKFGHPHFNLQLNMGAK